jgi:hypothetical protein
MSDQLFQLLRPAQIPHVRAHTANCQLNRNDARASAQIMRTGWYRQVHVRAGNAGSRTVLDEMGTIENVVRAILREAGIKLGAPSRTTFAGCLYDLAGAHPVVSRCGDELGMPVYRDPPLHC